MSTKPVVIVGPTASGKSSVAMAVAQAETSTDSPIHIVAVDAMQVYRDMNIGTAKPTVADQTLVPHHCIDLVDSHERFTVAEFKKSATTALESIAKVNGRPLFVAGTGLYLTAVIDDLVLPGEFPETRVVLEQELNTATLFERLNDLDPDAAKKLNDQTVGELFEHLKCASVVESHLVALVRARVPTQKTELFKLVYVGVAIDLLNA